MVLMVSPFSAEGEIRNRHYLQNLILSSNLVHDKVSSVEKEMKNLSCTWRLGMGKTMLVLLFGGEHEIQVQLLAAFLAAIIHL
jgi:hypothetical protein